MVLRKVDPHPKKTAYKQPEKVWKNGFDFFFRIWGLEKSDTRPCSGTQVIQDGEACDVACKYDDVSVLELDCSRHRDKNVWYLISPDRIGLE